jgi:bis(5'-nucleosyl)-tetraphosphatase (symmetrical)
MATYAIGDIQGCNAAFTALLRAVDFDPRRDRLWLVGDLVNRGPDSLGVLRTVIALGDSVTAVLGNHDLHLLATAAGERPARDSDTFQDVLEAPDAIEILDWLRHRPLLHLDEAENRVLVHAGIPPQWSMEDAVAAARDVEEALRGEHWRAALHSMYGNEPSRWSESLDQESRRRFTINALTRMRFCAPDGALDFSQSGPPGSQPDGLVPWFDAPGRRERSVHVVFGHWAALGLMRRADVTALDSGCVWGNRLTAVRLDAPADPIQVSCGSPCA